MPYPKPNEDRVFVVPEPVADKTEGGLIIPDIAKGNPVKGKVVAVGPGKACVHCGKPKPIEINIGDVVVFPESAGHPYKIGDEDIIILRATDIQFTI